VKLVVGLGNPGPRHQRSRHNVGFRIVDHLARAQGVQVSTERFLGLFGEGFVPRAPGSPPGAASEPLCFLKPATFMNRSGDAIAAALAGLPDVDLRRDLLVVYDDLDLPLGRIRVRPSGGAGGHNGLADVIDRLDSREFARLRFGIGRPAGGRDGVIDFVLEGFSPDEERVVGERVPMAAEAAVVCLRDGPALAMDRFNADSDRAERSV
jgi:PTH1 family peptidyl-tRNA hydrolase